MLLWLAASRYTAVDGGMIPTGGNRQRQGNTVNFTKPTRIGARIGSTEAASWGTITNFVLDGRR